MKNEREVLLARESFISYRRRHDTSLSISTLMHVACTLNGALPVYDNHTELKVATQIASILDNGHAGFSRRFKAERPQVLNTGRSIGESCSPFSDPGRSSAVTPGRKWKFLCPSIFYTLTMRFGIQLRSERVLLGPQVVA